ncbi:type III PLP-dependent enzyme domain-containing protein [Actinacidiphila bryophytorum]|nr:diaminopimelate decarboxylase [Actinacidiphila bryophytorum]MBM9440396.1 diaminopimelate decarboxylase [Actinacidiphila bryophytorum]MBN6542758.1 diaminopimelate decarboxylase [Actinacidiphila bryophytorum]
MTDEAAVRRQDALRSAVETGLVNEAEPVVGLLDVAGVRQAATSLHAAFATPGVAVEHTFAVKAASLVPVLALLGQYGLGAEVASPGELALARAAGIPPERTVLDSPAKTTAELREALSLGIAVNADNPQEIARIDALLAAAPSASPIGLRVNPQVGGGSIDAMSTATATSKFGVALRDPGAEEWVLRTYAERPWLNRLHTHTGSQGVPLPLMAAGVRAAYDLAERINAAAGRRQVTVLDIGGGLPVNFASDDITPSFGDYADLLRAEVPGLFDGRYGIVTEFGRALLAKHGTVLARVEYAKSAGGRAIAVTHAGAQVATRTVFAPEAWPLRVLALDAVGRPKTGAPVVQDVAGPCCFAGDLVAQGRALPLLDAGDHVALLDTGAYYFSTHFAYNSLPRPAVWAYTAAPGATPAFALVRAAQSPADLLAESGAGLPPLTP